MNWMELFGYFSMPIAGLLMGAVLFWMFRTPPEDTVKPKAPKLPDPPVSAQAAASSNYLTSGQQARLQ